METKTENMFSFDKLGEICILVCHEYGNRVVELHFRIGVIHFRHL